MTKIIDLRSDTVTKPTDQMLEAMFKAEVGDDGYREDPTVNRLEELTAKMMGKEAALMLPSGIMANELAILTVAERGDEIIVESNAHILTSEMCGPAVISSVQVRPVEGKKGVLDPEKVKLVIRAKGKIPRTRMLCVENTHNRDGGTVTSVKRMGELSRLARENGLFVYVDGARIFNASVALAVTPAELVADADAAMFCLSKGLSAPGGSLLVGSKEFIDKARTQRLFMGGQMRQIGYFAAAGIVALETMIDRLKEDHQKARMLAHGLKDIDKIVLDMERVQTNIVTYDITPLKVGAMRFLNELDSYGVKAFPFSDSIIRMCVHRHITSEDIAKAIKAVKSVVVKLGNGCEGV